MWSIFKRESDYLYLGLLCLSVFYGRFLRRSFPNEPETRKTLSTLGGFLVALLVSGPHVGHTLFSIALQNLLFCWAPSRYLGISSFVLHFLHLFFFRMEDAFGIPLHTPISNAIQMMIFLKMVGLAFDYVDMNSKPSFMDIFHFSFSHATILTGPYVRYRTFVDYYSKDYFKFADCDGKTMRRFKYVPIYALVFLSVGYFFPFSVVRSPDFYDTTSVIYRIFYFTPTFCTFRMRFYIGFILAECACIMYGIGAYPSSLENKPGFGPTASESSDKSPKIRGEDDYDFITIKNIDPKQTEIAVTMREALRQWNMTVQNWLVIYVYKKFPYKAFRTLAVMAVSSAWHGVHSGYYLSLGSVPLVLAVEDLYDKILRRRLPEKYHGYYDFVSWFLRVQAFSYLSMAFQLLHIHSTITFWKSVYFVGHTSLVILYLIGLFIVKPVTKKIFPARL